MNNPVALITGGGRRIGAEIVKQLHNHHFNVVIHYLRSSAEANDLAEQLNMIRENSATTIKADLTQLSSVKNLAADAIKVWGRLNVLINNASNRMGRLTSE